MPGRFINTSLFSPIAKDGLPPEDSIYYDSFWDENYRYVIDGYSVGGVRITGDHYWFLNFWKVRGVNHNTGRKGIIYPRFLEIQYDYTHHIERARKEGKNICILKRRQIGATEFHAALGGKEFCLFPGSQTVYVAGLDTYTDKLMSDTKRGLNNLFDTEFYKNRFPDSSDYCRASYMVNVTDRNGQKTKVAKGFLSEIFAFTAKGNPQVVSSRSPSLIIFEEFGIFPNGIATYRFVEPSLYAEGTKTGMAIFVGTGGEVDGALSGVSELEKIFYNPDDFNCLSFDLSEFDEDIAPGTQRCSYFIPDWKYYKIDSEGNNLKEESIEILDRIREEKEGTDSLQEFCVTMPRKPSDAFMLPTGGYFGKMVASMLNKRRADLMNHESLQKKEIGRLEWIKIDGTIIGVEWIPDPNGNIDIYEHPMTIDGNGNVIKDDDGNYPVNTGGIVPEEVYYTGTDSYDKDEAKTSVSKGACVVRKKFYAASESYNFFCAKSYMREENAYDFYENTAKLTYYYNSRNLIEWSNILIFDWYKRNGMEFLLALRPDLSIARWIVDSKVNNNYGIDPSTKREWLKILKQTLKAEPSEIERMVDLDLIKAFINYKLDPKYNCDLTIAASLCMVQVNETMYADEEDEEIIRKESPYFGYIFRGGKLQFTKN